MPLHDSIQARTQRRDVQRAAEPQRDGDVVVGAARVPVIQKPEPLLGEGERDRAGFLTRANRSDWRSRRSAAVTEKRPGKRLALLQ